MKKLIICLCLLIISPQWLMAGGLVTGAAKYKYESGDKVLFQTDFHQCPIGEPPQGFEKFKGALECVKYNNHMYIAPSTIEHTFLYKKVALGNDEFSLELTVMEYGKGDEVNLEVELLGSSNEKDWSKKLGYGVEYHYWRGNCKITVDKIGKVLSIKNVKEKPIHIALQVRRKQLRVFVNGKRTINIPFKLAQNINVTGFMLHFSSYQHDPYGILVSNIKAAKYTKQEQKPTPEKIGISVIKTNEGLKLSIPEKVLFDFNKFTLKPEAKKALSVVADFIHKNPPTKIVVIGYTDNVGSDEYNIRLSLQRAQSVADYLIYCEKIDPKIMEIEGKGKADPIASNDTPEGQAKNRRVEIKLIKNVN